MKRLLIPTIILLLLAPFLLIAQEDEPTELLLSVSGERCALEFIEFWLEATPEPEPEYTPEPGSHGSVIAADSRHWLPRLPHYLLSDDCDDLEPLLTVPSNGTLWLALLYGDQWLELDTVEDDPNPPQLDGRGRYFGCVIPDEGAQVCYVVVTLDEADYLVAVPLWVGDAYFASVPTATDVLEVQDTPIPDTADNSPPPAENVCVPTGETYCVQEPLSPEECPPPASGFKETCYDSCGNIIAGGGECGGDDGNNE